MLPRVLRSVPEEPPYRIRTARLVLRCWEPSDGPSLSVVAAANKRHLTPWVPWARHEPQTPERKAQVLRAFRGRFDLGQDFSYGAFDPGDGSIVGGVGLHTRAGEGGLEVGYWVDQGRTRRGYASEMAASLTRVGIELLGAIRIELHTDPENEPSRRVALRLGFREEGLLRARSRSLTGDDAEGPETWRDSVVFSLLASELAESPCARYEHETFDVLGRPMQS
jgi:RimJ/RimL family protein N-acetyltransferase